MSVVRSLVGWVVPVVILGVGIALFLSLGSQPPPARKEQEKPEALAVRTVPV